MSKVNVFVSVPCPNCSRPLSRSSEFLSDLSKITRVCDNCGYNTQIWRDADGDVNAKLLKKVSEPGYILLKHRVMDQYFIVAHSASLNDDGTMDEDIVGTLKYIYEYNRTPDMWLGGTLLVDRGNFEPEFEFLRWVTKAEIYQRWPDLPNHLVDQLSGHEYFVHELFPELTKGYADRLPPRDLSAYVSDFELFKAIEFIRFGPEKTLVMNGVSCPSRRDPVLRTQAHVARLRNFNFADTIHHLTGTRLDIDTSHIVPLLWGERYWRKSDLPNHHLFKDLQDES